MDKQKYIEALNLDLEYEMSSIVRYLHHSFLVRGHLRGPLSTMFREKAQSSKQHAITLGEKITALGGHPSVKMQEIPDQTKENDPKEMIRKNLEAQTKQLELYIEHYHLFEDNDPLRMLIEQFILEEVKDIEDLEMYLRENGTSSSKASKKKVAQGAS